MDWSVTLLVVCNFVISVQACEGEPQKLGMGSGEIKNSSITSSSALPGFEAYKGRIIDDNRQNAWCPEHRITQNTYEWIQIDFGEMVNITYLMLEGEFNDGEGTRFARNFRIEYQRIESNMWKQYVNHVGQQIFNGNINTRNAAYWTASNHLLATRVRIIPVSDQRHEICMRLEFFGCRLDGVASYSVPQGDTRENKYEFIDRSYDGQVDNGRLTGGLGLLTNGTVGGDNFSDRPTDWLGWSNDFRGDVVMLFDLDHLRNISEIRFHCNNQHSKDIRIFEKALVYVSSGGDLPADPLVVYEPVQDDEETSRFVSVQLNHPVAKLVKVVLKFRAKWMLISEVQFVSRLMQGQLPQASSTTTQASTRISTTLPTSSAPVVTTTVDKNVEIPASTPLETTTRPEIIVGVNNNEVNKAKGIDKSLIGIIVGSCVGSILVVVLIITACCYYQRKKLSSQSSSDSSAGGDSINIPPVLKTHTTDTAEYDLPWGSRPLPHPPPNGATMNSSGYSSEHGTQYACIPIDQFNNCHQQRAVSSQPCLHHYMTSGGLLTLPGIHHERHQCGRAAPSNTLPANSPSSLLIPLSKSPLGYDRNQYDLVQQEGTPYDSSNYRSSPTVPLPNIQSATGSSVYGMPTNSYLEEEIPNISYDSLRLVEKLGAGQYGEVHLCQMVIPNSDRSKLVAMKKLQPNANEIAKNDFIREIRIMSKLKHPNIVQVIGICTPTSAAESPFVVTEYMSRGDLNQFLQKHVPEGTNLLNKETLSVSTLLHIASQIAHGMSYLEQLNVTHRDLAARNCLVGDNYQVKISDFGMSRNLYSQQYYKVEGRVILPIRWMAWESVLLGKFTTKSDVWSFGVTLWEIFSFAREQPFTVLSDDEVITNCMNYYSNNMSHVIILNQPSQCPKEFYELMKACWNHSDLHRPTFQQIGLFLNRHSLSKHETISEGPMTRLTTC